MRTGTYPPKRTREHPGTMSVHWITRDALERPNDTGLPRLVLELRTALGPDATPEKVARELQARGVETTADAVRAVWDEGHAK